MTADHVVTLCRSNGRDVTVKAGDGETILGGAEQAGVGLPYGCRTGACGTCVGRLTHGTISYQRPPRALKPDQRTAGYVLCCIARPRTDCTVVVGADVRQELLSNPLERANSPPRDG